MCKCENECHTDILGKRIKVLDAGHVELCEYMGNDETVVRCARQSYRKDEEELSEEIIDRQLGEMLKNKHSSPFEQAVFRFHLRVPIFVARQIVRHRTARMNEVSGRYSEFSEDSFHIPGENSIASRMDATNKFGKSETYSDGQIIKELTNKLDSTVKSVNEYSFKAYKELLSDNIPRELAREVLPLNLYTEFYWQMDLHNLLHFLELRLEEHAQKEVREYALVIYHLVKKICPITIKYFTEFQLNKYVLGEADIRLFNDAFTFAVNDNVSKIMDVLRENNTDIIYRLTHAHVIIQKRNTIIEAKGKYVDEQLGLESNS